MIIFSIIDYRRISSYLSDHFLLSVILNRSFVVQLHLGNLDSKRDWGHARDYVEAMWMMLQHDKPEDVVIATGEVHSVREFVEKSFEIVGVQIV